MDGSSSNFCSPVPVFSGEGFRDWSAKMKQRLISQGVWNECVEETTKSATGANLALSLIHHSLSPAVLSKISHATTPKQAWDTLHSLFQLNASDSMISVKEETVTILDPEWVQPLSGNKPFFDMVLMKSSVKPLCHMNFPVKAYPMLPSTNLVADVRFNGLIYEVYFYGQRKQKSLGSGWRQLVECYLLMEGDFLVFEVLESSDSVLKMNMQMLRPTIPIQLQRAISIRERESNPIIQIDDDDDDDEDDDADDHDDEDEDADDDDDDDDDDDEEDSE